MSDTAPQNRRHIPWVTLLAWTFVVVALGWTLVPKLIDLARPREYYPLVSNARQIFIASLNMANDFSVNNDPHLGWPGDLAVSPTDPVHNLSDFAERIVKYDYVKRADLDKLFAGPGVPHYPGTGVFGGKYSAFKIYLSREDDTSEVLFCATKNFTLGKGLDASAVPYGDRGAVVVHKGGDAWSITKIEALDPTKIGVMPGHKTAADPGEETSANVWR